MNFKHERIRDFYLRDTQVENFFIAEYMVDADGMFIKVYLTALMYADTDEMSNSLIARHLGINEEDVLRAWSYWESKGVIRKIFPDPRDRFHYTVEFQNLKGRLYGAAGDGDRQEQTRGDLPQEMDDDLLRELTSSVEDITGRLLEGRETESIIQWLYEDGLEPGLITFAYRYCVEKRGQKKLSYVAAVLREWKKEGIFTEAAAEKYLDDTELRRAQYRRVMQAMGFYRNPTEAEESLIDRWMDDFGFSIDRILEACSRTTGIGNPNFNYLNGILTRWHEESTGGKAAPSSQGKQDGTKNAVALVQKSYQELRRKNESLCQERKKAIFASIPRIEEIEAELRRASMELSKAVFKGGSSGGIPADALKRNIKDLEAEEEALLTQNGFPADYLELQTECKLCGDTGVLDSGERCSCFAEKLKAFIR